MIEINSYIWCYDNVDDIFIKLPGLPNKNMLYSYKNGHQLLLLALKHVKIGWLVVVNNLLWVGHCRSVAIGL